MAAPARAMRLTTAGSGMAWVRYRFCASAEMLHVPPEPVSSFSRKASALKPLMSFAVRIVHVSSISEANRLVRERWM